MKDFIRFMAAMYAMAFLTGAAEIAILIVIINLIM